MAGGRSDRWGGFGRGARSGDDGGDGDGDGEGEGTSGSLRRSCGGEGSARSWRRLFRCASRTRATSSRWVARRLSAALHTSAVQSVMAETTQETFLSGTLIMGKATKATRKFASSGQLKKTIQSRKKHQQVKKKIEGRRGAKGKGKGKAPVQDDGSEQDDDEKTEFVRSRHVRSY